MGLIVWEQRDCLSLSSRKICVYIITCSDGSIPLRCVPWTGMLQMAIYHLFGRFDSPSVRPFHWHAAYDYISPVRTVRFPFGKSFFTGMLHPQVWKRDQNCADHTYHGTESVRSVLTRAVQLVEQLDTLYPSSEETRVFILVSHGDTSQILQTHFLPDVDMRQHRSLPHMDPGGWRVLHVAARTGNRQCVGKNMWR